MQLALSLRLQRIPNATRAIYYNQEYEALARRSFGQILTELTGDETLTSNPRALLQKALNLRNHLTHHFFWDFAEEWFSQEGRLLMIQKLREAAALFSDVGDEVGSLVDELGMNLGIGHDAVLRIYDRLLNEARQKYGSA
jgi:hypothetical protein